jgi:polysaccharide export outer membrane protein
MPHGLKLKKLLIASRLLRNERGNAFIKTLAWHEWVVLLAALLMLLAFAPAGRSETGELSPGYVLGPGDEIRVSVVDLDDIGRYPIRIDLRGTIDLPIAGRLDAAGMTAEQLEAKIAERLSSYLQKPDVTVAITDMNGQPVTVLGSVQQPGVQQVQGRKTLMEVVSQAGGLSPDAGYAIRIARRKDRGIVPLDNVNEDETGQYWVAEVGVTEVLGGEAPAKNIPVKAGDVITVAKGRLVYVLGAVNKTGGFLLGERQRVTVLEALSMAEGLGRYAQSSNVKILRKTPDPDRREEIAVNLKRILKGSDSDLSMQAEDILFIPQSTGKKIGARTAGAAVSIGSGIAIWSAR